MNKNEFLAQMEKLRSKQTRNADQQISRAFDRIIAAGKKTTRPQHRQQILHRTKRITNSGGNLAQLAAEVENEIGYFEDEMGKEIKEVTKDVKKIEEEIVEGIEEVIDDIGDFFKSIF